MKNWYQSKTILVNLLILIMSLTAFLTGDEFIRDYPTVVAVLGTLQGVVNIILRFITSKAIGNV